MQLKNMKLKSFMACLSALSISAIAHADGSFVLLNNSLYKIKFIATVKQDEKIVYTQASIVPAPINSNGAVQLHTPDAYYSATSNVPVGTLAHIEFKGTAQNFDIQILDAQDAIIKQINLGTTLGAVVDNDTARVVYVYNNVDNGGNFIANKGGAVYFWDKNHALQQPWIGTF